MNEEEKTEKIRDFIQAFDAIEQEMEPYKDAKRDLRANYKENEWLSTDEMRLAIKAYRMLKKDEDLEELQEMYGKLLTSVSAKRGYEDA
jgi:acetyl-CoA carboxylase carboxyltransferase component